MYPRLVTLFHIHKRTLAALLFGLTFSAIVAYATPPSTEYNPGATLDPSCVPGSTKCTVTIFPDQTSNAGKYLTTDGTSVSWATVAGGTSLIGSTSTLGTETLLGTSAADLGTASDIFTVFIGIGSGQDATNASLSNFIGHSAGAGSTDAHDSNFIGNGAGADATSAYGSNFIGIDTGNGATYATRSTFIGQNAGANAGADSTYDAAVNLDDFYFDSNFIGFEAGSNGTFADHSNFIGHSAGVNATNASQSNFFGERAGDSATDASGSNFLGYRAGLNAITAAASNFIGANAGANATNSNNSNFIGANVGIAATDAHDSTFIGGNGTANSANNAHNSIFIGVASGSGAQNAANSIFIGDNTGIDDTANNTSGDDYSILIGNSASTAGFENSIALGSHAINTASNQFMIGSTTRRIDSLVFNGGTGNTCSINATTGITCSSDERLKTNITDIPSALDALTNIRTVTYNWKTDPNGAPMIGFIAQNLQQYFPQLVTQNIDGMLSVNYAQITPVLTRAIQELNIKVNDLTALVGTGTATNFGGVLQAWFANASNHITRIFTGEICLTDDDGSSECLNKAELGQLKQLLQTPPQDQTPPTDTPADTTPDTVTDPELPPVETPTPDPAPSNDTETPPVSDPVPTP